MNALQKGLLLAHNNIRKNSPTYLSGFAVAGLITTAVYAVKATPKALEILHDERVRRHREDLDEDIPIKEQVLLTWKCYIPSVVIGSFSIACIIGANHINLRRSAAMMSLYSISEQTLREYQAKVVDTIGKKKEGEIKDSIAQDKINANPVSQNQIFVTSKGDTLCYDSTSGRYFKSDIETLRKIQNDMNHALISDMWMTLNELYDAMGLPQTTTGAQVGWNVDKMIEFRFSSMLAEGQTPCIVIDHENPPSADFR